VSSRKTRQRARRRAAARQNKRLIQQLVGIEFPALIPFPATPTPSDLAFDTPSTTLPDLVSATTHCDVCHFDFVDLFDHQSSWTDCSPFPGLVQNTCKICSPGAIPSEVNPTLYFVHDPFVQFLSKVALYFQENRNPYQRTFLSVGFNKILLLISIVLFFRR